MVTFYSYKVDNRQMQLANVPEPYQSELRRLGYTDEVAEAGEGE